MCKAQHGHCSGKENTTQSMCVIHSCWKGRVIHCLLYLLYIQFWTRIEPQKLADIQCLQLSVLVKWKGNNVSTLVVLNGISSYGKFLSCWIFCSKVEILPGNGGNGNFLAIFNLTCYKCVAWEFVIVLEFQVPLLIRLRLFYYLSKLIFLLTLQLSSQKEKSLFKFKNTQEFKQWVGKMWLKRLLDLLIPPFLSTFSPSLTNLLCFPDSICQL